MNSQNILLGIGLVILLSFWECSPTGSKENVAYQIPTVSHDLGYIPFDSKLDDPNYQVCDSTNIASGRNHIQYKSGAANLKKDIISNYSKDKTSQSFNGFVVIRFLINCQGKSGRYRAQALSYDFAPKKVSANFLTSSIDLIKKLDSWSKSDRKEQTTEYLKFINLRFEDGEIQHVLL